MNRARITAAIIAALCVSGAQAVEVDNPVLSLTPQTVMPGTPFVASLTGEFSQTCLLGPGVVTGAYSNDGFEIKFRTGTPGSDCTQGTTLGADHFGAFRLPENAVNFLDPDLPMKVTFIVDNQPLAEAMLDITFTPAELPFMAPTPGIYWDFAHNGSGLSMEDFGGYLFVAGFLFDGAGDPVWRTAQGTLEGSVVDTQFLSFEGGSCLLCGDPGDVPDVTLEHQEAQFLVNGPAEVFLTVGNSPGRATHLVRFDTQLVPPEERAPMLFGTWTFVDLDTGLVHQDLQFAATERVGDMTSIASTDGSIEVDCLDYGDCTVSMDGVLETCARSEITPDRIAGNRLLGVRTR